MHKNILAVVGITILFVCVRLSGCQEEKTTEKFETSPLKNFALTLNDLPKKYTIFGEDYNYSEETIKDISPFEFYFLCYVYEEPVINSTFPVILLYMFKFNSSTDANIAFQNLSEKMVNLLDILTRTTPQNIKQIGDESIYELFEGNASGYYHLNVTYSFIYFRIGNVVIGLFLQGLMNWEIDYIGLTINYAEIIESRINSSLE